MSWPWSLIRPAPGAMEPSPKDDGEELVSCRECKHVIRKSDAQTDPLTRWAYRLHGTESRDYLCPEHRRPFDHYYPRQSLNGPMYLKDRVECDSEGIPLIGRKKP
jgi:hypothetical protein